MIFVFLVLTVKPHVLQKVCNSFNSDCNAWRECAKMTASSANKSMHNLSSSTVNKLSILVLRLFEMSFMKNKNSIVEHGSPCFTPKSDSKKPDSFDLYLTHAFTALYILSAF